MSYLPLIRCGSSLRTQLIAWNVMTLALLLAALGIVTRLAAVSAIMVSVNQNLEDRARMPPHGPGPFGPPPDMFSNHRPSGPPPTPPPDDEARTHMPRMFDSHGQPMRHPNEGPWDPAALALALRGQKVFSDVVVAGEPLHVLTRPDPGGGAVQVAYPMTDVDRAIGGLDRALLLLIPLALLVSWASGVGLTARVLRPFRRITLAVEAMGDMPSARLPRQGEDEFAAMADTFNGLLERLDQSFQRQAGLLDQQRRFTADASHELKTPLTVIQGTASQMQQGRATAEDYREAMADIAGAAAGMARLVQDLLLLARADEQRLGADRAVVLAREVLTRAAATLTGGVQLAMQFEDEILTLWGNEEELTRLFANLLQNAARATAEASGSVTVTAKRHGRRIAVTVADTGIGIAPEHLAHLGERFYRVDSARARRDGGSGLGLSICRSIVAAHGGEMTFASIPGEGTVVSVILEACPPPTPISPTRAPQRVSDAGATARSHLGASP